MDSDNRGDPRYKKLLDEQWELHCTKSFDYGDRCGDPLENLRASEELGIAPWLGTLLRAGDKWRRIRNFVKYKSLKVDKLEDDLRDMQNYLGLALVLYIEEKERVLSELAATRDAELPLSECESFGDTHRDGYCRCSQAPCVHDRLREANERIINSLGDPPYMGHN